MISFSFQFLSATWLLNIEEIFNEKISDGQLSNAPITFQELDIIRGSFQTSLEGLYHQRVLYPEITEEE